MLTHKGTQQLETLRLILRRFTVDDAQAMFENWASDERVTRYLTWPPHDTPALSRRLLEKWCASYDDPATYNWGIVFEGKLIGNISVVRFDDRCEYAELGYCMGFDYWNRGIMSEAAQRVIDFLFDKVNVNRVGISHAADNPASGGVAKKCGMTYEGTKREYFKTQTGEFLDISDHSILRREWETKMK